LSAVEARGVDVGPKSTVAVPWKYRDTRLTTYGQIDFAVSVKIRCSQRSSNRQARRVWRWTPKSPVPIADKDRDHLVAAVSDGKIKFTVVVEIRSDNGGN
jgi:hypothetical protein